jgi:hypothetical protein
MNSRHPKYKPRVTNNRSHCSVRNISSYSRIVISGAIFCTDTEHRLLCMYVCSLSVTYGNVFRHPISSEVCPPSLHLADHILPLLQVRLLSILFSVSLFSFFKQTSNLKLSEVIFLHPFFGHVQTKLIALPKCHQELYFFIHFSVIISFLKTGYYRK